MAYVVLFPVAVPVFALAFSATVKFLGLFWGRFQTSGGGFGSLYARMLGIATVYLILSVVAIGGLLGLVVMTLCYKGAFGAGWVEALVVGILGGVIGWVLFIFALIGLAQTGLPLG